MSYLVLARKYRPQTFDDLVGQEHVTQTLLNALAAKRSAHAYIFSGSRGCGKTTTARLLARALNCLKGPTANPCGECAPCAEIAAGTSPDDVLEIDGASNRGIDQIRELRDTVKYAPSRCRYRIFIIDEAHQITEAGFNALLKTLEEPPAHAVFMMATTELQKIPSTILSRCQRFQLKPISPLDVQARLEKIVKLEKLAVAPDALAEVARSANGSLRDALSLLDQVIAYAPEGATAEHIRSLLGLLPRNRVTQFAQVLRQGEPEKVLEAVQQAVEDGFDLAQLARDLADYWHEMLLAKAGVPQPHLSYLAELETEAKTVSLAELERNLRTLSRCLEQMRRSESPRVTFELCALELAQKPVDVDQLIDRLEALEKNLQDGASATAGVSVDVSAKIATSTPLSSSVPFTELRGQSAAQRTDGPSEKKKSELNSDQKLTPSPFPLPLGEGTPKAPFFANAKENTDTYVSKKSEDAILRPDQLRTAWMGLLEMLGTKKPSLESCLLNTRWQVTEAGGLDLLCTDEFRKGQVEQNMALVREGLLKNLPPGLNLAVRCVVVQDPAPVSAQNSAASGSHASSADEEAEVVSDEEEGVLEPGDSAATEDSGRPSDLKAPPSPPQSSEDSRRPSGPTAPPEDLDPVVRMVLKKFPGKLKKIENFGTN